MKFRNMIFVMAIAFSVIFISMIGTSYAYYVATVDTDVNVTTGNIDTGVAVVFAQSQYINVTTGIPIRESDVATLVSASTFTITPDSSILSGAEVAINIGIADLSIDNLLINSDLKYRLSCNNGTNDVLIVNGNGTYFDDTVIEQRYLNLGTLDTINGTLDINKTYTCNFKVWLQETGGNQNSLMNKRFMGLIKVNTLFKK